MNLHEYQGKELLSSFGVAIQRGKLATTVDEAVTAFEKLILKLEDFKKPTPILLNTH